MQGGGEGRARLSNSSTKKNEEGRRKKQEGKKKRDHLVVSIIA
jgi:hypothetical protein